MPCATDAPAEMQTGSCREYRYGLYGLSIRSEWPFPFVSRTAGAFGEVDLRAGSNDAFPSFAEPPSGWFQQQPLKDGSLHLRWTDLFEFLVSRDGRRIVARPLRRGSPEAFHTFLLGQVLSFALIRQGIEPLHATVVVIGNQAVALLGNNGYGKSTLAAAFLQAGHRLVTDDLLVLTAGEKGFCAHPGPPRIKLAADVGRHFLGADAHGTPMIPSSSKLVFPLASTQVSAGAVPLEAMYVIAPPNGSETKAVAVRPLSQRRVFVKLVRNTFNTVAFDTARIQCQFDLTTRVAATVPVKAISYPRALPLVTAVRDAILDDLRR